MYAGAIVEHGPSERVLTSPRHPYTRGLAASVPDHRRFLRLRGIPGVAAGPGERPSGCPFAPRCPQSVSRCTDEFPELEDFDGRLVRCFEAARTRPVDLPERAVRRVIDAGTPLLVVDHLRAVHKDRSGTVVAADAIEFAVARGECVALVGESGSGKTTVARCIAGLHPPAAGRILLGGEPLHAAARHRRREQRRRLQIIFQNPYESLNPRRRVIEEVARPAAVLRRLPAAQARDEATALLERVRLPTRLGQRYPGELSGGERQRVAIARALSAQPEMLVCDEITSALDVSVQAAVVDLLNELRDELSLSLLFITHNLGVVASIADRVLILDEGAICEQGEVDRVFRAPESARTRELLDAAPTMQVASRSEAASR
jgi:peptide/nickel transport system ATP-binding protein